VEVKLVVVLLMDEVVAVKLVVVAVTLVVVEVTLEVVELTLVVVVDVTVVAVSVVTVVAVVEVVLQNSNSKKWSNRAAPTMVALFVLAELKRRHSLVFALNETDLHPSSFTPMLVLTAAAYASHELRQSSMLPKVVGIPATASSWKAVRPRNPGIGPINRPSQGTNGGASVGASVAGASVAGASVAGASVAGASVAGALVAGASVAGESVATGAECRTEHNCEVESNTHSPLALQFLLLKLSQPSVLGVEVVVTLFSATEHTLLALSNAQPGSALHAEPVWCNGMRGAKGKTAGAS
jgi:hypothetical protein